MECQGQQEKLLQYRYNITKGQMENRSLLLNWAGDLVPTGTDKAEELNRESSPTMSQRYLVFSKGFQELPAVDLA